MITMAELVVVGLIAVLVIFGAYSAGRARGRLEGELAVRREAEVRRNAATSSEQPS